MENEQHDEIYESGDSENGESSAQKRPPGRPRKQPLQQQMFRKGILTTPEKTENVMEFVYDNPLTYKKICALFKTMNADDVRITFTPESVILRTQDHYEKTRVLVRFNAAKLAQYYCDDTYDIYVKSSSLENASQKIDKTFMTINLYATKDTINNTLSIVARQTAMSTDHFDVISSVPPNAKLSFLGKIFSVEDYDLEFIYGSKYFKGLITDISNQSKVIQFEKLGKGPLTLKYGDADSKVKSFVVHRDDSLFQLFSKLEAHESLSIATQVAYIKPIATSLITESLKICLHRAKPIVMYTSINGGDVEIFVNVSLQH
ncbi:MAG TPA: hypothetical protein VI821_00585 [Candidatus Paceibacterota bacterium]